MVQSKLVRRERCPACEKNGRDNSGDNLAIYDDGHSYCYSCGYREGKGGLLTDVTYTYEYIPLRGIERKTLEFFDVKTKVDPEGKPIAIGFKYPSGRYKVRLLSSKDFYWTGDINDTDDVSGTQAQDAGNGGSLFGRDKFTGGSNDAVYITEGEFDALSLAQSLSKSLDVPVVSVRSSNSAVRDCSSERSFLNSFSRIYLAFDADGPGREAMARVASLFDYRKVYVVDFDRRKDANEYLQAGEEDELRTICRNAKRFLPQTVIAVSEASAAKILAEVPKAGVPYPFPTLNAMTYGIRRGESVLITAQEGVGKTELMHAIEAQILRETDDPVGGIFIEEPKRDHLQALAAIELGRPVFRPDSGVPQDQVVAAVKRLVKVDDRLHLYSHFGSDDPEVFLDTIRFMVSARGVVYVLLDHISMVISGISGEKDERRAFDYIATRLEMMVKELDFSLIFVSHVNDDGQTRGSRYISKVCDVRINLKRDLQHPDEVVRNTIELDISKNRPPGGKTGFAGRYLFDPYTRKYKELSAANDNERADDGFQTERKAA